MRILRISTAGSVDDGKSTLIGRLLYDTNSLSKDKIEGIEKVSKNKGLSELDLSLFTDGLTAEREQGITIDVAHIYFNTPNRKYIISDTPGHIEYTRNMITGASNASVFMILIDARNGIIEQTKRHLFIASLLQIQNIVFVINKMDLVAYDQQVFDKIKEEANYLAEKFNLQDKSLTFIPVSAKIGDNVVNASTKMDWYEGQTLLSFLENVNHDENDLDLRFNVQYVIRPQSEEFHDYRAYAGKIKSGEIQVGDKVSVLSSGQTSVVKSIDKFKTSLSKAVEGDSISIQLEDDIDISRGDTITLSGETLKGKKAFTSKLCWLSKDELIPNKRYLLQSGSNQSTVKVSSVKSQLDFSSLSFVENGSDVKLNSINQVEIKSAKEIFLDPYKENPKNGYFILIDENSNSTVAVGFSD